MTRYMLDTNVASEAVRGHPLVDARLQAQPPGQWCISAVTCSEMRYGLTRRPKAVRLHEVVEAFLSIAAILPWDTDAANRHGALRADLKARGTRIGDFDEMIAAHALATHCIMVTDNTQHFMRVPALVVENWKQPPPDH